MSKYKDLAMAKKDSAMAKASNLKGGVKGKVNGVLGRKSSTADAHSDRAAAAPLHTLRDPSSFAPPPRRNTSGLASPSPSESASRGLITAAPSRYSGNQGNQGNDDYDEASVPPSRPYRVNTTGLSTDHLPPPPARRDGANEKSPPSYDAPMTARRAPPQPQPQPQPHALPNASPSPSLPPRLPPRSDSSGSERVISAMPSSSNLNQGAISRLGAAGIRVPAFGIGKPRADVDEDAAPPPPKPPRPMASQPNLLQSRLSPKPLTAGPSSSAEDVASQPREGTTWAQKQAALRTASAFHKDPSSISFADARAAASTANNFRQRHGHQVAAGVEAANSVNQKYGVADRLGALSLQHSSSSGGGGNQGGSASASTVGQQFAAGATAVSALAGKKKPPPPPPPAKKKPGLAGLPRNDGNDGDLPPPVPFATRPSF